MQVEALSHTVHCKADNVSKLKSSSRALVSKMWDLNNPQKKPHESNLSAFT